MQIDSNISGDNLSITIRNHITGISEVAQIKTLIDSHRNIRNIDLNIIDAYVIPSMLIGYLVKLIKKDKKSITINCSKKELKQLIKDLNLDTIITIR